jgi:hypothetical protein
LSPELQAFKDATKVETYILFILVGLILFLGIMPGFLTEDFYLYTVIEVVSTKLVSNQDTLMDAIAVSNVIVTETSGVLDIGVEKNVNKEIASNTPQEPPRDDGTTDAK